MSLSDKVEGWAGMPRLSHDFPMSSFADAIAVTPTSDPTIWKGDLKRDWCIGLVPHGGYIGSVLTHAAAVYMGTHQKKYNQPDIIASHYEFLARSTVGPCTIHVTPLKLGRQLSNLRVQLLQPDPKDASQQKVCCEALIVQGNLTTEASNGLLNLETKPLITKDQIVDRSNCLAWGAPGEWAFVRPAAFKVEGLFPPGSERYGYTDLSKNDDGPSVRSQWMRFAPSACAAQKFKVEDLPYLCDAFAPMPENYGLKGNWYPTVR
ncbi:thioesterase-like superfamily-domain-containing protein [Bisporella sp. PMI_857]|nr:thioesterase-like superfamily-domain-containing protein [Bisporella sp. PMI_857]